MYGRADYIDNNLKIEPGSVLIYYKFNTPIFHSGLYLGNDRVMHTAVPFGEIKGEILTFCNINNFLMGEERVIVITTMMQFMT